jgi:hypothetical protein
MTQGRLAAQVDRIVARADGDGLRRHRERQAGREVSIWDSGEGLTEIFGRLITTEAQAVDARLEALAATVCAGDPRTRNQRRADAMGGLSRRRRPARLSLRTARLPRRRHTTIRAGGDSRHRRGGEPRGHRSHPGIDDRRRRHDPRRADRRPGPLGHPAATGAPQRRPARSLLHTVAGIGGLCPLPGSDLPLPWLRSTRATLRPRPHDRLRGRWPHTRLQPHLPMPPTPLDQDLLGLARPPTP